ncbi:MAG: DUF2145 domain-containing protein [Betaproteobacteria bacterium]|nr:DUF2145 domain-containing protein [Betaproteobacteria bacterium]
MTTGTVNWKAARLFSEARAWALGLALALAANAGWAGSLNYCQGETELAPGGQDRLIQVAALVKAELDRSGQPAALVARSGLALQRFGQRYSHAGVSLQASANTPWSVRQLYYACDAQRPRIFDQGMSGFVLGVHDSAEGYVSIILLPDDASRAVEHAALDNRQALQLLGANYSANAYAFGQQYQNCNQWLAELLAVAWGALPSSDDTRGAAQSWLQDQGYRPTVFNLRWRPLMWLAAVLPWLHSGDHPADDLDAARFRVSMPQSITAFVQRRFPEARQVELCYTARHIVVRRGWEPIAAGCQAADGDEVLPLASPQTF